jgi:hypothetical protein
LPSGASTWRAAQGLIVRHAPRSEQRLDHRVFLNDDAKDDLAILVAGAMLTGG